MATISFDRFRQAFTPRQPGRDDEDIFKKAARKVITDIFGIGRSENVLTPKTQQFLRSGTPKAQDLLQQIPRGYEEPEPRRDPNIFLRAGAAIQPLAEKPAYVFGGGFARDVRDPEKVEQFKQRTIAKLPQRGRQITEPLTRAAIELPLLQNIQRQAGLIERDLNVKFDALGRATVLDTTLSPEEADKVKRDAERRYVQELASSVDIGGIVKGAGGEAGEQLAKRGASLVREGIGETAENLQQKKIADATFISQARDRIREIDEIISGKMTDAQGRLDVLNQRRAMFGQDDIKEINRLKSTVRLNKKIASGDVETARELKPELTNNVIERIKEVTGLQNDDEAFDFAKSFPTKKDIRPVKDPEIQSLFDERKEVLGLLGDQAPAYTREAAEDITPKVVQRGGKLIHEGEEPFEFSFEKITSRKDKDLIKTMKESIQENFPEVQRQRRGKITDTQLQELAQEVGMTVEDVISRKPGSVWNAEELEAVTQLIRDQKSTIRSIKRQISDLTQRGEEVPEALNLELVKTSQVLKEMLPAALGARAELGRGMRSLQSLQKIIDDSPLAQGDEIIRRWFGDSDKAKTYLDHINSFDPDDADSLIKYLQKVSPATPIEKMEEYWYNSVLSAPSTHFINMLSNTAAAALRVPESALAGGIDAALQKAGRITGRNLERTRYATESLAELNGIRSGFAQGIQRAAKVLREGSQVADMTKLGGQGPRFQKIKGKIGDITNLPSRFLVAGDEFFKALNYDMSLHQLAWRNAKNSGLSGDDLLKRYTDLVAEPTEDMISQAVKGARYFVFQKESDFADAVVSLRNKVSVNLGPLGEVKPLRFVIPFVQTPTNVVSYGLERTPLGGFKLGQQILKKAPQGEIADQAARVFMGTTAMAALAWYAADGKITAGAPKNQKERDAFFADGKQPWSIRIGDQWVQYNRIEPLNAILSQVAIMHEEFDANNTAPTPEKIVRIAGHIASNITDQTFLTSLGDLIAAIEDPDRSGERFIGTIASGFIPSSVRQLARVTDRTVRDPDTIADVMRTSIPGLSQTVPAKESEFQEGGIATRQTSIPSELIGIRTSADQGTDFQGQVQNIQQFSQKATERTGAEADTAESIYNALKAAPTPEAKQDIMRQALESGELNERIADRIVNITEAEALGLTGVDRYVKSLPNLERAEYLLAQLESMDPDQKRTYFATMLDKKIITENVADIMVLLMQRGS